METVTLTETGCHLDNHRGHYITAAVIDLAVGYGWILDPMLKWVVDQYDNHNTDEDYPHEGLIELADEAIEWLNSGQEACDNCDGGMSPRDGDYWTHKDDADKAKRCKKCTGYGRGPRLAGQNFPPKVPEGARWGYNDGDFGLYTEEEEI